MIKNTVALALLAIPLALGAREPDGSVTSLALPAHQLTDVARLELSLGRRVAAGDRLVTGVEGRIALQLRGGARLNLGGESELQLHSVETQAEEARILARMALARGSVRLDSRGKGVAHDVRLNVGNLRLRALGAELWAATESRGDSVCLLSGSVEISTETGQDRLEKPGDCLFFNAQYRRVLLTPNGPDALARKLASTAFAGDEPLNAGLAARFTRPPSGVAAATVTPAVPAPAAPTAITDVSTATAVLPAAPPAADPAPPQFGPSYVPETQLPPLAAKPEPLNPPTPEPKTERAKELTGEWTVIVASLENERAAWKFAQQFSSHTDLSVRVLPSGTGRSRVALGRFESPKQAQQALRTHPALSSRPDAWILRERP